MQNTGTLSFHAGCLAAIKSLITCAVAGITGIVLLTLVLAFSARITTFKFLKLISDTSRENASFGRIPVSRISNIKA